MRQLNEKDKVEIANEYYRRVNKISKLKKNIKRICIKSLAILIPITAISCIFVGPLGLFCLVGFLFPIICVDYYYRLIDDELNMCLKNNISLRQIKKAIKSGEMNRYITKAMEEEKSQQFIAEIYDFAQEEEQYTPPMITKFEDNKKNKYL